MTDQRPGIERAIVDEAIKLAEELDWGPLRPDMSFEEARWILNAPEGLDALARHEKASDLAVRRLGDLAHWDVALLRSLCPDHVDDGEPNPAWHHLVFVTWIVATKKAEPLEERANQAARAALSWIPTMWNHFETDALLEAPRYFDQQWIKMSVDGLDPLDTTTALAILNGVLAERVFSVD